MKSILVIGGTHFIGRMLVERLRELNKYSLTLFNRGKSKCPKYDDVTYIYGDRNTSDVALLQEGVWEVVIDMSSYFPHSVGEIVNVLRGKHSRYILISTCSVYDEQNAISPFSEKDPVFSCSEEQALSPSLEWYGHKKAECERIVLREASDCVIFRPALVFGKYDYTDRLYYWMYQTMANKEVILPDEGTPYLSLSYVEDVVQAIVYSIENNLPQKIYNTVSYPTLTFGELVGQISDILAVKPTIINAPAPTLHQNNIQQWTDMPLWIDGDSRFSNEAIIRDILHIQTPLETALTRTAAYYEQLGWHKPQYGLSEEKLEKLKRLLLE